ADAPEIVPEHVTRVRHARRHLRICRATRQRLLNPPAVFVRVRQVVVGGEMGGRERKRLLVTNSTILPGGDNPAGGRLQALRRREEVERLGCRDEGAPHVEPAAVSAALVAVHGATMFTPWVN